VSAVASLGYAVLVWNSVRLRESVGGLERVTGRTV
jgi:hypothetical protein